MAGCRCVRDEHFVLSEHRYVSVDFVEHVLALDVIHRAGSVVAVDFGFIGYVRATKIVENLHHWPNDGVNHWLVPLAGNGWLLV